MNSTDRKVSIIGAGNVGSTYAFALMIRGIAQEIAIIDKNKKKALGECMDLNHGLSFTYPLKIYEGGYEACVDSDIIVITAGANQKPGQSRIDLLQTNVDIFKEIVHEVMRYVKKAIILVVTNPVDILTYITLKLTGLPVNRVFGSGTVLDTSRLRYLISEHCKVDPRNVHAYIIGEHGDSELPVWSNTNIGGMNIKKYCAVCKNYNFCDQQKELNEMFDKVKNAAYQIVDYKGATYYAIALSLVRITEAILRNENSILPVSTLISDYYDVNDVCLGIPSLINKNGIEYFLKIELSQDEQTAFKYSMNCLKDILQKIKL